MQRVELLLVPYNNIRW